MRLVIDMTRLLSVCALLALVLPLGGTNGVMAATPPDIVVLLIDDMRADDWPVLADTRRLVGGTMFPNFIYTTPLCCPTRATLQRGQYAHNTGITRNQSGKHFTALDNHTIATALESVGYHTVYIGKYMNHYPGRAPGWDVWGMDNPGDKARYWRGTHKTSRTYITDALTDDAIAAVAATPADEPLFLMFGHIAPHQPWVPDPQYATADVGPVLNEDDADRKRTLLSVDDSTERLAAAMGARWDTACVLVLSDNGYMLGEHGARAKSIWWDEAVRVPLLIRCPGISGNTDSRLAATIDIAPTILAAAGTSADWPIDGKPLQEHWDRDGVLIESWVPSSDGQKRVPWFGIRTTTQTYVEPRKKPRALYTLADGESVNHLNDPSSAATDWAGWLAAMRDCAGASCDAIPLGRERR